MDPLSALGVASSILGVIENVWNVLTEGRAIYASPPGASDDAVFVETIARYLSFLDRSLPASLPEADELQGLVSQSRDVTAELLGALQAITAQDQRSRWESLVSALQEVWSREKIRIWTNKFNTLQGRLMEHIRLATR